MASFLKKLGGKKSTSAKVKVAWLSIICSTRSQYKITFQYLRPPFEVFRLQTIYGHVLVQVKVFLEFGQCRLAKRSCQCTYTNRECPPFRQGYGSNAVRTNKQMCYTCGRLQKRVTGRCFPRACFMMDTNCQRPSQSRYTTLEHHKCSLSITPP
jgi:hypothetical protein